MFDIDSDFTFFSAIMEFLIEIFQIALRTYFLFMSHLENALRASMASDSTSFIYLYENIWNFVVTKVDNKGINFVRAKMEKYCTSFHFECERYSISLMKNSCVRYVIGFLIKENWNLCLLVCYKIKIDKNQFWAFYNIEYFSVPTTASEIVFKN